MLSAIICGCKDTDNNSLPKSKEINPAILHPAIKAEYDSLGCDGARICNSVIRLSCKPEVDGPVGYYDSTTGDSIMYCGGTCLFPDPEDPKSCKSCPPSEWECQTQ